jgi:hypothetical protein
VHPRVIAQAVALDHTSLQRWAPGPPGGAGAGDLEAPTINVKMSTAAPREVAEVKVREHPPSM